MKYHRGYRRRGNNGNLAAASGNLGEIMYQPAWRQWHRSSRRIIRPALAKRPLSWPSASSLAAHGVQLMALLNSSG